MQYWSKQKILKFHNLYLRFLLIWMCLMMSVSCLLNVVYVYHGLFKFVHFIFNVWFNFISDVFYNPTSHFAAFDSLFWTDEWFNDALLDYGVLYIFFVVNLFGVMGIDWLEVIAAGVTLRDPPPVTLWFLPPSLNPD